jgi:integrase
VTGTPSLDIVIPGVGRIHRHVGTSDPKLVQDVRAAVRMCVQRGRIDVLQRLYDRQVSPLQVYNAVSTGTLNDLVARDTRTSAPLLPKLRDFATVYPKSEAYRKDIQLAITQVEAVARQGARLSDLPDLLRSLKSRYERRGAAVTFNRHKRVLMSFATWALGEVESPLWNALRKVPAMPYTRPDKPGLTVKEFRDGVILLPTRYARTAWSLVTSGMRWKEFTEDGWRQDAEVGITRVFGVKRSASDRVLPYLCALTKPEHAAKSFRAALARAFPDLAVTPHTFRRTYIQWAEDAGIPRFRVKMYCGHAVPTEVHDLYLNERTTTRELGTNALPLSVIAEDRKKLVAYIGRPLGLVDLAVETRTA